MKNGNTVHRITKYVICSRTDPVMLPAGLMDYGTRRMPGLRREEWLCWEG